MTEITGASPARSRRKVLQGTGAAILAVAAIAVLFVLPAEYGIDPTGAGKAMGLTKMSEPGIPIELQRGMKRTDALFPLAASAVADQAVLQKTLAAHGKALPSGTPIRSDRFTFELQPFEGIELKYELAEGAPMAFAWRTTAPVHYDMHSHPYQGGTALTESYSITDAPAQTAVYVAPFLGIHGWYWQNQTLDKVTLTLDATGAFTKSVIFDAAGEHPRPLAPPSN